MDCSITNLIFHIIGAIGSLATFGFIFFFRKDKDKKSQIDNLTGIVTFLEAQNETIKEQNNLIAQQVEIKKITYKHTKEKAQIKMEDYMKWNK